MVFISTSNSLMITTVLTKIDEAKGEILQKANEIYSMTKIIHNDTHEMDSSYLDEVQIDNNDTFEEAEDQGNEFFYSFMKFIFKYKSFKI